MNLGNIKTEVKKIVGRNDLSDAYINSVVNQVIRFIDTFADWWFTIFRKRFYYNGDVQFEYDLSWDNIKSIKKIYYCMPGKNIFNQRLFLLPAKNIEEATLLLDYAERISDVPDISVNYFYGGVYYIEDNKIKTLPPTLRVNDLYIEGYKYLDKLEKDFDYNWLTVNYPSVVINGVLEKVCVYYEMYDIAEKYKDLFFRDIKSLLERNNIMELNRKEGDLDELWGVKKKDITQST